MQEEFEIEYEETTTTTTTTKVFLQQRFVNIVLEGILEAFPSISVPYVWLCIKIYFFAIPLWRQVDTLRSKKTFIRNVTEEIPLIFQSHFKKYRFCLFQTVEVEGPSTKTVTTYSSSGGGGGGGGGGAKVGKNIPKIRQNFLERPSRLEVFWKDFISTTFSHQRWCTNDRVETLTALASTFPLWDQFFCHFLCHTCGEIPCENLIILLQFSVMKCSTIFTAKLLEILSATYLLSLYRKQLYKKLDRISHSVPYISSMETAGKSPEFDRLCMATLRQKKEEETRLILSLGQHL